MKSPLRSTALGGSDTLSCHDPARRQSCRVSEGESEAIDSQREIVRAAQASTRKMRRKKQIDASRLAHLAENHWIDYPRARAILEKLERLVRSPDRTRMPG